MPRRTPRRTDAKAHTTYGHVRAVVRRGTLQGAQYVGKRTDCCRRCTCPARKSTRPFSSLRIRSPKGPRYTTRGAALLAWARFPQGTPRQGKGSDPVHTFFVLDMDGRRAANHRKPTAMCVAVGVPSGRGHLPHDAPSRRQPMRACCPRAYLGRGAVVHLDRGGAARHAGDGVAEGFVGLVYKPFDTQLVAV